MRRVTAMLLTVVLAATFAFNSTGFVLADQTILVKINGVEKSFDQMPVMENDRVLVPMRGIFEALGATVAWEEATETVSGQKDGTTVVLKIGDTSAQVNGQPITLDVPARLINDRTMVPIRFISESLGAKVEWDDAAQTVLVSDSAGKVVRYIFDDRDTFEEKKDFVMGAAYQPENVSLSTEQDHTTGSGKSLKMANREKADYRVKFDNVFSAADIGKTFTISAWVYSADGPAQKASIGAYGPQNSTYAYEPIQSVAVDVPQGKWTQLAFTYKHEDEIITQVGIDQRPKTVAPAPTLYIDDIEIVEEGADGGASFLQISDAKEGRRPVPIAEQTGKSYDDLIFYPREFEEKEINTKTPEEMFAALPEGRVVVNQDDLMAASVSGEKYGKLEQVPVDNMPFDTAWRASVLEEPLNIYDYQLVLENMEEAVDFKDGDNMLLVFNMQTIDTGSEDGVGKVQCIVEQDHGPNAKALQEDVTSIAGKGWHTVYLPFVAKTDHPRLCIRLGYQVQTIEFGGYELINYEDKVDFEDLPSSSIMKTYDGRTVFEKDDQWRKDAWDRIEKIRKGDINVIVKDAAGNPVPDAKVDVNMFEHEFRWGSAVNTWIIKEGVSNDRYRTAVSALFNEVVLENNMKWNVYEKNPEDAREMVERIQSLGIKNIRGHTLMWDRSFPNGYDPENTTVPEDLYNMFVNDDRAGIDKRIHEHMLDVAGTFKDNVREWDVVNELLSNNAIRTKYGNGVLVDWFAWAREANSEATLYVNETGLIGTNAPRLKTFRMVLDDMVQRNVDFDGIGVQGHFGNTIVHPMDFYADLEALGSYGKKMKITEFDMGTEVSEDREYEASFTRDILITVFSQENMEGFLMWGFYSGAHWLQNAPIFDQAWNLKESGRQFIDLVYNKWWTQESGVTGADGKYTVSGYYGDYDITVTANGQTKTVEANCYKGWDNTFIITLD